MPGKVKEIEAGNQKNQELQREIDRLKIENDNLKNQMPGKVQEIEELKSENELIKTQLPGKDEEIVQLNKEIANLQTQLQGEKDAKRELDGEKTELENRNGELDRELEAANKKHQQVLE